MWQSVQLSKLFYRESSWIFNRHLFLTHCMVHLCDSKCHLTFRGGGWSAWSDFILQSQVPISSSLRSLEQTPIGCQFDLNFFVKLTVFMDFQHITAKVVRDPNATAPKLRAIFVAKERF